MNNIAKQRWSKIDELLKTFKNKYVVNHSKTEKEIQNIFNSLDIEFNDLNKPIKKKDRVLLDETLKKAKKNKLWKSYFKYRIEELMSGSINYRDYIEIMLYCAYINDLEDNIDDIYTLISNSGLETYNQGRADLKKKTIKTAPHNWLNMIPTLLVSGTTLDDYLFALALTNMQELQRQTLINIQQQKELDVNDEQIKKLFNKQSNRLINVNGDKISGGLDKYVVSFANEQYVNADDFKNQKCRFIAVEDKATTKMCHSLDGEIFNTRDLNTFKRYSESAGGMVEYSIKGLHTGINLPPIDDHFHWCRSTITYLIDDKQAIKQVKKRYEKEEIREESKIFTKVEQFKSLNKNKNKTLNEIMEEYRLNPNDKMMEDMAKENNFANKPQILTKDEYKEFVKQDGVINTRRVVHDGNLSAKEYSDQFKYGEYSVTRGNMYGNGIYTNADINDTTYVKNGVDNEFINIAFDKNKVNIATFENQNDMLKYYRNIIKEMPEEYKNQMTDMGKALMTKGYQMAFIKQKNYYVIYDRNCLYVEE